MPSIEGLGPSVEDRTEKVRSCFATRSPICHDRDKISGRHEFANDQGVEALSSWSFRSITARAGSNAHFRVSMRRSSLPTQASTSDTKTHPPYGLGAFFVSARIAASGSENDLNSLRRKIHSLTNQLLLEPEKTLKPDDMLKELGTVTIRYTAGTYRADSGCSLARQCSQFKPQRACKRDVVPVNFIA
ncbi:hypothetical protein J2794_006421 [Paraburkholderia terricola]|nr:hypothetical protein [Paraburkholderia terricola]